MVLTCPDGAVAMVVDSADPAEVDHGVAAWETAIATLLPAGQTVPLVLATHPHADHIGDLPWLFARNPVELLVDDGMTAKGSVYKAYAAARARGRINAYHPIADAPAPVALCSGQVTVTLFAPADLKPKACARDLNRCSVLARVEYGDTRFLLTGDAERTEEAALLRDPATAALLPADVLKVGHHGSDTASTKPFLARVRPTCAVISAGTADLSTRNSGPHGYHHPRIATLDALNAALPAGPMRAETVPAYGGHPARWQDHEVKEGVSLPAIAGDVVIASAGHHVTCR